MGAGQQLQQHLAGVEEGEEVDLASPHASASVGNSAADLAGMGAAAEAQDSAWAAANGAVPRPHSLHRNSSSHHHHHGSQSEAAKAAAMAARVRHRAARAAVRRAPQYALEGARVHGGHVLCIPGRSWFEQLLACRPGTRVSWALTTPTPHPLPHNLRTVLSDLKRGLPSAVLLELPPGGTWRQDTHAVLLRGQLAAELAPELAPLSPRASRHHHHRSTRSADFAEVPSGLSRDSASASAAGGAPHLRRASVSGEAEAAWEAGLVATAAAAAAPRVLPWLDAPRYRCNAGASKLPTDKGWVAGGEGALLLVCLTDAGEVSRVGEWCGTRVCIGVRSAMLHSRSSVVFGVLQRCTPPHPIPSLPSSQVPAGVPDAEAAAEAAAAAAVLLQQATSAAMELKSHPLDMPGPPSEPSGQMRSGAASGDVLQGLPVSQTMPRPTGLR